MKKFVIILCIAILMCLGVAEGYLRIKGYHPFDFASYENEFRNYCPVLGWVPEVGKNKINVRDDEAFETVWPDTSRASREKMERNTKKRILLVGCSYTYGFDLDDKETWAWKLNERFPNVTFDNYGVMAYGTYQSFLREKEQLAYGKKYDLVIYSAIYDHLNRNVDICCKMGNLGNNQPYYLAPRVDLDDNSQLVYYSEMPPRWSLDNCLAAVEFGKRAYYRYLIQQDELGHQKCITARKIKVFELLIQKMKDEAEAHGSKFLLCLLENKPEIININDPDHYICPCLVATDGRGGEEDAPKFHISGDIKLHPSYLVNKNWAKIIGDYLVANKYLI